MNLCLAIVIIIAFSAMNAVVLEPDLNRIPSRISYWSSFRLLIGLAASFSVKRHRIHAPLTLVIMTILGMSLVRHADHCLARRGLDSVPCVILGIVFMYFMSGLIFYHAVAASVIVMFAYLAAGTALVLPGREFSYTRWPSWLPICSVPRSPT